LRERYVALAMIASGQPAKKVAARIGRRRQTLSAWVKHFNEEGPEGLLPNFRNSTATILTASELRELKHALTQSPESLGFQSIKWRGQVIARYIYQTFDKKVHPETARRYLRRLL
jgi:transposase